MTDYFQLFGQPRQPWLDSDALKQHYLEQSGHLHPDRVHEGSPAEKAAATQRFTEWNAAYQCLREDRDRILHLIELERGRKPDEVQRLPSDAMDFFLRIGQICREADALISQKEKASSPMLKLGLFEKGLDATDRLQNAQRQINSRREELISELRELNASWTSARAVDEKERLDRLPLDRLEQIYRLLSYAARWSAQIQDRIVRLSF